MFIYKFGKVQYCIDIQYKVTIIRGQSGTGKTTLVDYLVDGGGNLEYYLPVKAYQNDSVDTIMRDLSKISEIGDGPALVVIDEDIRGLSSTVFQEFIMNSEHQWIIISRDKFSGISTPFSAVGELRSEGKHYEFVPYQMVEFNPFRKYKRCYTEDSKSAFKYLSASYAPVESIHGKDNLKNARIEDNSLVLIDFLGAGSIGDDIKSLLPVLKDKNSTFYPMESFEKMILDSEFCQQFKPFSQVDPLRESNLEDAYADVLYKEVLPRIGLHFKADKSRVYPCLFHGCSPSGKYCPVKKDKCFFGMPEKRILPEDLELALEPLRKKSEEPDPVDYAEQSTYFSQPVERK